MTCIWESNLPNLGEVTTLAWRNDSKILSAGYLLGDVCLFTAGDGFVFHQLQFSSIIDHLAWTNYPEIKSSECVKFNAAHYFPNLNDLTTFKS